MKNKNGIHARHAMLIARKAMKYRSEIWIEKEDMRANAKDMLQILTLGAGFGSCLNVIVDGDDAEEALQEVGRVIANSFIDEGRSEVI